MRGERRGGLCAGPCGRSPPHTHRPRSPLAIFADNKEAIQQILRTQTGQEHVPYLFVGGKHVPDAVSKVKGTGTSAPIRPLLEAEGIKVSGYFRT